MFECLWCVKVRKCERWRVAWEKASLASTSGEKRHEMLCEQTKGCSDYEEDVG